MPRLRLAIFVLLFATGCASGPSRPGPNDGSNSSLSCEVRADIVIDDSGIRPDITRRQVGDAITVTNRGTKDHGLTSESIDTGTLRPGEFSTVCFTEVGTIEAYDRVDPSHKARIEVSAAASP